MVNYGLAYHDSVHLCYLSSCDMISLSFKWFLFSSSPPVSPYVSIIQNCLFPSPVHRSYLSLLSLPFSPYVPIIQTPRPVTLPIPVSVSKMGWLCSGRSRGGGALTLSAWVPTAKLQPPFFFFIKDSPCFATSKFTAPSFYGCLRTAP